MTSQSLKDRNLCCIIFSRRAKFVFSSRVAAINLALLGEVGLFVVSRKDIYSRYLDSESTTILSKLLIYLMLKLSQTYYKINYLLICDI